MTRFWRVGFALHLAVVTAIGVGAYLGRLPTFYRAIPHCDLIMHAVLFGLLAFFLDGVLGHRPLWRGAPWLRLAPLLVLGGAAVEEVAQALSPRRTASVLDFSADVVGVVLFVWLAGRVSAWATARRARGAAPTG